MTPSIDAMPAHPGWFIVSQVKSHRVVYFTDDVGYQPPTDGDWFFVTHYLGDLPTGMTLKNCWSWRCDGQQFRHANDPVPESAPQRLVESNRRALRTLLRNVVDELRKPWLPSCALGETLREAKLAEARAHRLGGRDTGTKLLLGLAVARDITLDQAADLVLERHEATLEAIAASEAFRERFLHAIETAVTNGDLSNLRRQLLTQLDASQLGGLPSMPTAMSAADLRAELQADVREIEVARLQTRLRHIVNAMRRRIDGGYDQNDALMRHKAKMAQAILNNGGQPPEGQDTTLLANLADSRSLSLADAARLVLGAVTEGESILRRTEREKDRFLARIDAARTLQDFQVVCNELRAYSLRHASL